MKPGETFGNRQLSSSTKALIAVLGCLGMFGVLICGGSLGFIVYLGTVGPDTAVYRGTQIPNRFAKIMRDDGALEDGESIAFFYSDAMTDIHDGYYFVSDRKVVIYRQDSLPPLLKIAFDEIASARLVRDISFLNDSFITLELNNGEIVLFPVSSERDRDQLFFDEIQKHLEP